jgi:hypothetical protein
MIFLANLRFCDSGILLLQSGALHSSPRARGIGEFALGDVGMYRKQSGQGDNRRALTCSDLTYRRFSV